MAMFVCFCFFFLIVLRPPRSTLTYTLFPYTPLFRSRWPDLAARRRLFDRLLSGPLSSLLRRGDRAGADRALEHALSLDPAPDAAGSVALVGAGPGDSGLLTLRALPLLNQDAVILPARLVTAAEIGRATGVERMAAYVYVSVCHVQLK